MASVTGFKRRLLAPGTRGAMGFCSTPTCMAQAKFVTIGKKTRAACPAHAVWFALQHRIPLTILPMSLQRSMTREYEYGERGD